MLDANPSGRIGGPFVFSCRGGDAARLISAVVCRRLALVRWVGWGTGSRLAP